MKKKTLVGIICIILILCVIGISYALWNLNIYQQGENIIESSCFDISFKETENTNISLSNAFPLLDSDGSKLTPYIFTIKNNCDAYVKYELMLEVDDTSTLDSKNLKVKLNNNNPAVLANYPNNTSSNKNVKDSYIIYTGYLDNLETKEFNLRLWIADFVTLETEGIQNSRWSGKINVKASYVEKVKSTLLTDYIRELSKIDTDSIKNDNTLEKNLRYVGANPNNYVSFGETYQEDIYDLYDEENDVLLGGNFKSEEECQTYKNDNEIYIGNEEIITGISSMECKKIKSQGDPILWRIIGLMNDIDDGTQNKESRIKIIRADSIGRYSWDSTDELTNEGWGVNEWRTSKVNEMLNNYFYNSLVDQNCYLASANKMIKCSFKNDMSSATKLMIDEVVWPTGSNDKDYEIPNMYDRTNMELFNEFYTFERSGNIGKICSSNDPRCNDTVERTTSWTGKIGLIYPSDYLFADTTNCEEAEAIGEECIIKNWLYLNNNSQWTMTPMAHEFISALPYTIFGSSLAGWDLAFEQNLNRANNAVVKPVAYLKVNTLILSGTGEEKDPFVLGI